MKIQEHINELFTKYLDGTCSPIEWEELLALVSGIGEEDTETLAEPLFHLWEQARNKELPSTAHLLDKARIYADIVRSGEAIQDPETIPGREAPFAGQSDQPGRPNQSERPDQPGLVRRLGRRIIAAAVVAGLLITGSLWYLNRPPGETAQAPRPAFPFVKPGIIKAVLTLAGGQRIILDSSLSGAVSKQGNTTVVNLNGQLAYNAGKGQPGRPVAPLYNTVSTARANQYRLLLPDGSKVWLNAISSIRFPTAFTGKDRTVEITGEAYFEVARNASKPFHVKVGSSDIDVLGTHFNVNAYADEPVVKTSLLEGSVKITGSGKSALLIPGQEAALSPKGELKVAAGNVELATAWKDGYFQFDRAPLPVVMRQIGRWYDLDIQYAGAVPDRIFKGKFQRDLPLSGILHLLQEEDIRFQLKDKILTVTE